MNMTQNAVEMVRDLVAAEMGDNYTVKVQEITKNNDTKLTGIIIMENGSNIAPTIYLDGCFEKYEYIEDIVNTVLTTYKETAKEQPKLNTDDLTSFAKSKELLTLRLVSASQDLNGIPHRVVLGDLAVIMIRNVSIESDGCASIKMTNDLFRYMGKTFDELYELALANTERLFPSTINGMNELMLSEMAYMIPEETLEEIKHQPEIMYVMSNKQKMNGSISLLYSGMIEDLTEKYGSFIVIPSSIHETIIVPMNDVMDIEEMTAMVQEVNGTQVSPDEVLSDHAYVFRNGKLVI